MDGNDSSGVSTLLHYTNIVLIIAGLIVLFNSVMQLAGKFDFLWKYLTVSAGDLQLYQSNILLT